MPAAAIAVHLKMAISSVFVMDLKGKVIISRNYRGDISMNASDRFARYIQEKNEMDQRPIFTDDGLTFAFIRVRVPYSPDLYHYLERSTIICSLCV